MGDAAHAMLPFTAQGGAMGIGDGAALAECLDRARDINEIPKSMQLLESIWKPRTEAIAA
jgi:salicylate hydroxylase